MGQYSTAIIRGADGPTAVSVIKRNSKLSQKKIEKTTNEYKINAKTNQKKNIILIKEMSARLAISTLGILQQVKRKRHPSIDVPQRELYW